MRSKRPRGRPVILLVTPALVGGSWMLIHELAGRLAPLMEIVVAAVSPRTQTVPDAKGYRIPWLDYEEYGPRIDRSLLAVLWFEMPLAVLSLILWAMHRPRIWLGNGLLSSALGIIPQKIAGGHLVVSYNAYMAEDNPARIRLARLAAQYASLLLVNSQGSFEDARAFADAPKIRILPLMADDIFFTDGNPDQLKKELHLEDRFVVAFVGRLDVEKHCDFVLKVAEVSDPSKTAFVFVGHGPLAGQIEDASRLLPNVIALGRITDRAKLRDVYQMADVVWSYADETYLAKPAVEALAAGTSIIVPELPAIATKAARKAKIDQSLVPSAIGRLVSLDDPARIAKLIDELRQNGQFGREARRRCREYAYVNYSLRKSEAVQVELLELLLRAPSD